VLFAGGKGAALSKDPVGNVITMGEAIQIKEFPWRDKLEPNKLLYQHCPITVNGVVETIRSDLLSDECRVGMTCACVFACVCISAIACVCDVANYLHNI